MSSTARLPPPLRPSYSSSCCWLLLPPPNHPPTSAPTTTVAPSPPPSPVSPLATSTKSFSGSSRPSGVLVFQDPAFGRFDRVKHRQMFVEGFRGPTRSFVRNRSHPRRR